MKLFKLLPAILIFSVDRDDRGNEKQQQARRWILKIMEQDDVEYKVVSGRYKGITEVSYVVSAKHLAKVKRYCRYADQDGFLYVHTDRYVDWHDSYTDGDVEPIGQLIHVSHKPDGDYTLDGGTYYEVI